MQNCFGSVNENCLSLEKEKIFLKTNKNNYLFFINSIIASTKVLDWPCIERHFNSLKVNIWPEKSPNLENF